MLKSFRKYNKQIMVVFSVVLLLGWLAPETLKQMGSRGTSAVAAHIDGVAIRAEEYATSQREITALDKLFPFFTHDQLGIEDHDVRHWLLLVHEAQGAGLIGGPDDGNAFRKVLAEAAVRRDPNIMAQLRKIDPDKRNGAVRDLIDRVAGEGVNRMFAEQGVRTIQEIDTALARAEGVYRLINFYSSAARFSDKRAALAVRDARDITDIDALIIDGARAGVALPAPTPEELAAHFDRFKGTRPGEGDYAIGYLLPPRLKLEYMTIDRGAIEKVIALDPVEVLKRHRANKDKYHGDFATDKPAVERDMRDEVVDRVLADAQSMVQAEVQKVTRRLDSEGKYKTLPADWEAQRPRWDRIAQSIVEIVRKNHKLEIPTPSVSVKNDAWLDQAELAALDPLGASELRQGAVSMPATDVLFWARELKGGSGIIPVQVLVPIELPFIDPMTRNRLYVTITAALPESAPPSVDEIRAKAESDWRSLRGFESLKERSKELRALAIEKGLQAVADLFPPKPASDAKSDPKKPDPLSKPLAVMKNARVERSGSSAIRASLFTEDEFRGPLNKLADEFADQPFDAPIPADRATTAIDLPKRLTVVFATIKRIVPFTREDFLSKETTSMFRTSQTELVAASPAIDPFSFAQLLKRHLYETKDTRVETPDQFQKIERSESASSRAGS
jgi:hypothetical protein